MSMYAGLIGRTLLAGSVFGGIYGLVYVFNTDFAEGYQPPDFELFETKTGRKLSYVDRGDPNGKPIFVFHREGGSRLDADAFELTGDRCGILGKHNVRYIAVDRPGYGESTFYKSHRLIRFSDDIAELADHLEIDNFGVLGVSSGGAFALGCAYHLYNRVKVCTLVSSVGPCMFKSIPKECYNANRNIFWMMSQMPFLILSQLKVMRWYAFRHPNRFRKKVMSLYEESMFDHAFLSQVHPDRVALSSKEAFRQGIDGVMLDLKLTREVPWEFDIRKVTDVPVIAYHGKDDHASPVQWMDYYVAMIPKNFTYFALEQAGNLNVFFYKFDDILRETAEYL